MVWQAAAIAAGASIAGGLIANRNNRKAAHQQYLQQKEFAQHGIRWRTADAKAAGLHPLYAIGANVPTYTPSYSSDALGPALAQAGQSVAEGYLANKRHKANQSQRKAEMDAQIKHNAQLRIMAMDRHILEQQRLQHQMRVDESQVLLNQALAAKALSDAEAHKDLSPAGGVGEVLTTEEAANAAQDTGATITKPKELVTNKTGSPSIEAGENPLWVVEKAGGSLKQVRLNDESAEAWGDVAAPVINAAATAYYYITKTLPEVSKNNWKWLVRWYFKNREEIARKMNKHGSPTDQGLQYGP